MHRGQIQKLAELGKSIRENSFQLSDAVIKMDDARAKEAARQILEDAKVVAAELGVSQ